MGWPGESQRHSMSSRGVESKSKMYSYGKKGGKTQRLVLQLKGTAVGQEKVIPKIKKSGTVEGMAFSVDLYDLKTGKKVGRATDVLADIREKGVGLALVGTTYFRFNDGSVIVTRGNTTVQPITTKPKTPVTHITGSVPYGQANNVIEATGKYKGMKGDVRLAGAVDMSKKGQVTFDCIFVMNLEKEGKR